MARTIGNYTTEIAHLRKYGSASNELESYNGVTYWSDAQLFQILERTVMLHEGTLIPINTHATDGYKDFIVSKKHHIWLDSYSASYTNTSDIPTYDANVRILTFASQQLVSITAHAQVFNMIQALAELWEIKAAQRFELIRAKGGANQLFLEQEYEHCQQRAQYYRNRLARRHLLKRGW
jgi:hypothetical protein